MRPRDRSAPETEQDTYGSLFGPDGHDDLHDDDLHDDDLHDDDLHDGGDRGAPRAGRPPSRVERGRAHRRRGRRRYVAVLAVLLVAVVGLAVWLVVLPVYHHFRPQDYQGQGTGSVAVTVRANDGAAAIAEELESRDVVASTGAFTDAADADSRSRSIQPGTYELHEHMSGSAALALLLDPSSRLRDNVVVTEGATTLDIARRLAAQPCKAGADADAVCGPGYSAAAVKAAFADTSALGVPTDFLQGGKAPSSVEGLLYPATYFFPEDGKPSDALQQMITRFAEHLRSTNFTAAARTNGFTPYQQLIAASIAQSEAKYPADMAKVVRVILNRIASGTPLRIDATSAYAAKLAGKDPTKVIYSQIDSPYNTYTHGGLPPTPISNPGSDALAAAAKPTAGNWLFYVNKDAAGHLLFTNSEQVFAQAVEKCRRNNWGCG